jgi:hypothetical protein
MLSTAESPWPGPLAGSEPDWLHDQPGRERGHEGYWVAAGVESCGSGPVANVMHLYLMELLARQPLD